MDAVHLDVCGYPRAHNSDTLHLISVTDEAGATVVVTASEAGSVLLWDGDLVEDRVGVSRCSLQRIRAWPLLWLTSCTGKVQAIHTVCAPAPPSGRLLKLREPEYATFAPITVLVCSWNVAAAHPSYVLRAAPARRPHRARLTDGTPMDSVWTTLGHGQTRRCGRPGTLAVGPAAVARYHRGGAPRDCRAGNQKECQYGPRSGHTRGSWLIANRSAAHLSAHVRRAAESLMRDLTKGSSDDSPAKAWTSGTHKRACGGADPWSRRELTVAAARSPSGRKRLAAVLSASCRRRAQRSRTRLRRATPRRTTRSLSRGSWLASSRLSSPSGS